MTTTTASEPTTHTFNQFKRLWIGQLVSILGSEVVQFALIWWITVDTNSSYFLSLSMFLAFLPGIIIAPFAGVLVDRWDKKTILIVADLLQAATTALLIFIFYFGFGNVWFIIGLNFVRSIFQSFHSPSFMTVVINACDTCDHSLTSSSV